MFRSDSYFSDLYRLDDDGWPIFKILVGGRWVECRTCETFDIISPLDGKRVGRCQHAREMDVEEAIDLANKNWGKLRNIAAIDRIEILENAKQLLKKYSDQIVDRIVLECGKPLADARSEVNATIERLGMVMEEARKIFGEYIPGDWSEDTMNKIALVIREPRGVTAAIAPFNYPLYIGAAKIIPAILAGNPVIVKPPSDDPSPIMFFSKILTDAGLPDGALSVVTGKGGEIGDLLVKHEGISVVNFTGSSKVGKHLAEIAGLKKLHLELGGKGMALVLTDADIDLAATKCVEGAMKNAGQRCDAVSVVLVMNEVADKFVEKSMGAIADWRMGDPTEKGVKVGPVINERAAIRIEGLIKNAVDTGATLLIGGGRRGCFIEPTILDNVSLDADITLQETFGPVMPIMRIKSIEDAIEIANRPRYGLDSCVFTNDFYRMWRTIKRLEVGGITVNDIPRHGVGFFPFGGYKDSGTGREGIGYSIEEMTHLKTIVFNLEPAGLGKMALKKK